MRPVRAKPGITYTSMVVGSPSSKALSRLRSSTVPATASKSVKCVRPSARSTSPRHASSVGSLDNGASSIVCSGTMAPPALRTSTSTVGSAPAPMRGLGDTIASRPARRVASASSPATWSGVWPARVATRTTRLPARKPIAPPLAGSPRSQPTAIMCAGGGSTTWTSSSSRSPKWIPHCPQIWLAVSIWSRAIASAPLSSPPIAGAPPGAMRSTRIRTCARSRPIEPIGVERGPPTRIDVAFFPSTSTRMRPPTSASSVWAAAAGCCRSIGSVPARIGALRRHASPAAVRAGHATCRSSTPSRRSSGRPSGCVERNDSAAGNAPGGPTASHASASGSGGAPAGASPGGSARPGVACDVAASTRAPRASIGTSSTTATGALPWASFNVTVPACSPWSPPRTRRAASPSTPCASATATTSVADAATTGSLASATPSASSSSRSANTRCGGDAACAAPATSSAIAAMAARATPPIRAGCAGTRVR